MKKILFALLILAMATNLANSEVFLTTNQIWDKVQLMGNFAEDHPVFSDTTNVQATLIGDAYAWVQGVMDGSIYLDRLSLTVTTAGRDFDLEATNFNDELIPVKIWAVRRKDTGESVSLFSESIDDHAKVFELNESYPQIYSYDRDRIRFNTSPAAETVYYVWAWREASIDSACAWGRKPPILSAYRPLLWFRTLALAKQKLGNGVAYGNISAITYSMIARFLDMRRLIEETKDIRVLPRVYQEE